MTKITAFDSSSAPRILIIGDGWGSVFAVATALKHGAQITWVKQSGSRPEPVVSYVTSEAAAERWRDVFSIEPGRLQEGSFLREHRGKSWVPFEFRVASPSTEALERSLLGEAQGTVFYPSWIEHANRLRSTLLMDERILRIEDIPVQSCEIRDGRAYVKFADQTQGEFEEAWFCDRGKDALEIEGLADAFQVEFTDPKPKTLTLKEFYRKCGAVSVLQVSFEHRIPIGTGLEHSLMATLIRESSDAEGVQRRVFGYFYDQGKKSTWSTWIESDELEDNHEIAKRIRRMKQAISKAFDQTETLGSEDFFKTVIHEKVRLEDAVFWNLNPSHVSWKLKPGLILVPDGFGLSEVKIYGESRIGSTQNAGMVENLNASDETHALRS